MTQQSALQSLSARRDGLRRLLHELAEEEIIVRAEQHEQFHLTIIKYEQERRYLNYLNKLPLILKTYSDACSTFLSIEYNWTEDIQTQFKEILLYQTEDAFLIGDDYPLELTEGYFNTLNKILSAKITRSQVVKNLCKLAKVYGLIKPRFFDRFLSVNKLAIKALIANHYSVFMKQASFEEFVRMPQKLKVKSHVDSLATMIGEDFVVFPKIETTRPLCPKDFIGITNATKVYPLMTNHRKTKYARVLADLEHIEEQLQNKRDADEYPTNPN